MRATLRGEQGACLVTLSEAQSVLITAHHQPTPLEEGGMIINPPLQLRRQASKSQEI